MGKQCTVYAKGDTKYVSVKDASAPVTHQEHNTVNLPEGDYIVLREREYDPFAEALRQVQD